MKTIGIALIALALAGCASAPKCPDESQEAVSVCRAERECKGGTGKQILSAFGMILGGAGARNGEENPGVASLNACIDRNLSAQRANAGMPDRTIACDSYRDGSYIKTECHSR